MMFPYSREQTKSFPLVFSPLSKYTLISVAHFLSLIRARQLILSQQDNILIINDLFYLLPELRCLKRNLLFQCTSPPS